MMSQGQLQLVWALGVHDNVAIAVVLGLSAVCAVLAGALYGRRG